MKFFDFFRRLCRRPSHKQDDDLELGEYEPPQNTASLPRAKQLVVRLQYRFSPKAVATIALLIYALNQLLTHLTEAKESNIAIDMPTQDRLISIKPIRTIYAFLLAQLAPEMIHRHKTYLSLQGIAADIVHERDRFIQCKAARATMNGKTRRICEDAQHQRYFLKTFQLDGFFFDRLRNLAQDRNLMTIYRPPLLLELFCQRLLSSHFSIHTLAGELVFNDRDNTPTISIATPEVPNIIPARSLLVSHGPKPKLREILLNKFAPDISAENCEKIVEDLFITYGIFGTDGHLDNWALSRVGNTFHFTPVDLDESPNQMEEYFENMVRTLRRTFVIDPKSNYIYFMAELSGNNIVNITQRLKRSLNNSLPYVGYSARFAASAYQSLLNIIIKNLENAVKAIKSRNIPMNEPSYLINEIAADLISAYQNRAASHVEPSQALAQVQNIN